jgi:uncharacterized protein YuzE
MGTMDRATMAVVKVWFDREGDFLEVRFANDKGLFREIAEDVFEGVDERGKVIGFAIFNVTRRERESVEVPLQLVAASQAALS